MGQAATEEKIVSIGFAKREGFLVVFGPLVDVSHLKKEDLDTVLKVNERQLKESIDLMGCDGIPIPVGTDFMTTGNYYTASVLLGLGGILQQKDHKQKDHTVAIGR